MALSPWGVLLNVMLRPPHNTSQRSFLTLLTDFTPAYLHSSLSRIRILTLSVFVSNPPSTRSSWHFCWRFGFIFLLGCFYRHWCSRLGTRFSLISPHGVPVKHRICGVAMLMGHQWPSNDLTWFQAPALAQELLFDHFIFSILKEAPLGQGPRVFSVIRTGPGTE